LSTFDTLWIMFLWNQQSILFIFLLFNVFIGVFTLSSFNTIILYFWSFVKINDYDPSKFIYYKNSYVQGTKLKDEFYAKHAKYKEKS
jgi:hypothetical protein